MRQDYIKVLQKLFGCLKDSGVNWAITGGVNFALQGVPVKLNDIDIQTDEKGAYKIEQIFPEFVIKKVVFSSTNRIRSYFGALNIDGIKIEIMGDIQKRLEDGTWEAPVELSQYKQFVEVERMQLPVLSLEYEYSAYIKLGRKEKVEMLRKWLQKKDN